LVESWYKGGSFKAYYLMANSDKKTILLEQAYEEIKEIYSKFECESGASDLEVKTLLRELIRAWEKKIRGNTYEILDLLKADQNKLIPSSPYLLAYLFQKI